MENNIAFYVEIYLFVAEKEKRMAELKEQEKTKPEKKVHTYSVFANKLTIFKILMLM